MYDKELMDATYNHDVAVHVYEKQVGETPLAYKLFAVYRDMGINRDLRVAAKDMGRSYKTVKNLSISNQWQGRVEAYDESIRRDAERKLQYEIIEARKRHSRLGSMILDFAQEAIENLRAMNDVLTVKDVVLLADTGCKIESTALGMVNEITESRLAADIHVQQTETIPLEIIERIGKEIASAKSCGEDVTEVETQFEELTKPQLLAPGNGETVPVKV